MKLQTLEILNYELNSRQYETIGKFGLHMLFDIYLTSEIDTVDNLKKINVNEFRDYIINNLDKIKHNENMGGRPEATIEVLDGILKGFRGAHDSSYIKWDKGQREFVGTVESMYPNSDYKSILDVGAGPIPTSSILFADYYPSVTTMDYSHEVPTGFLQHLKVKYKQGFFIPSTDISSYDIVVGRRPCKAIESIVENCSLATNQEKPFLIELCNCNFKGISYKELYEYLKEKYNKNLRMVTRYRGCDDYFGEPITLVHNNQDLSDSEIKKIVERTTYGYDYLL